jgi:hypothetical protein
VIEVLPRPFTFWSIQTCLAGWFGFRFHVPAQASERRQAWRQWGDIHPFAGHSITHFPHKFRPLIRASDGPSLHGDTLQITRAASQTEPVFLRMWDMTSIRYSTSDGAVGMAMTA